jgi:hypothetical protein
MTTSENTMIDEDLRKLINASLDRTLDGLESDIWRRLAVRSSARAAARKRVSLQSVLMLVGLVGSVAGGINAARLTPAAHGRTVLAFGSELAPSSLLLGKDP